MFCVYISLEHSLFASDISLGLDLLLCSKKETETLLLYLHFLFRAVHHRRLYKPTATEIYFCNVIHFRCHWCLPVDVEQRVFQFVWCILRYFCLLWNELIVLLLELPLPLIHIISFALGLGCEISRVHRVCVFCRE